MMSVCVSMNQTILCCNWKFSPHWVHIVVFFEFIYFQSPDDLRPAIADALCFLLLPQCTRSQAAFPLPTCHKSQHPVRKACPSLTYHLLADQVFEDTCNSSDEKEDNHCFKKF
ncbi:hypothetical protein fugu_000949 [Takifugu bimaculatus]|uniref:Uncharacterized protein n=1 Tax=Takifugu bimaculatus TaxID=433685 RepID=A0A4Z2CIJ4_9TELE|nr:hypothetical protein fugu_000949 [Takifugu bimaculatus]